MNDEIKVMYTGHNHYNPGDVGLDLFFPDDVLIEAGSRGKSVDLMIQCEALSSNSEHGLYIPYWLLPRSSISKTPLRMSNSVGIIDAGYRGNIIVALDNFGEDYQIQKGQRLFQISPWSEYNIEMNIVNELSNTGRGNNGFGSTGS